MNIFNLNQNQFSDLINLRNKVFYPLDNFNNKNEFIDILENLSFKKKYFPYPVFFGINKKKYQIFKNIKEFTLCYKSVKVAKIDNIEYYTINKETFGKKVFGKNFKYHPYYKKFKLDNFKFLNFKIKKI